MTLPRPCPSLLTAWADHHVTTLHRVFPLRLSRAASNGAAPFRWSWIETGGLSPHFSQSTHTPSSRSYCGTIAPSAAVSGMTFEKLASAIASAS